MRSPIHTASLALALAATGCTGLDGPPVPATPQRPTLSSDTSTTAAGTLEIEAGVAADPGDRFDSPTTAKWGAGERTELYAGWSPWVVVDAPGRDREGASDLLIGVRHRFLDETATAPSAAIQLATKLPTANDEVGTGEHDFFAAAILTRRLGAATATAFYQLGVLGDPAGRGSSLGHDLALAAGVPVADRWGAFAELAAQLVPDADHDAVLATGGLTFTPRTDLVVDFGVVAGLSDDAPDLQLVFGCTWNAGRRAPGARD